MSTRNILSKFSQCKIGTLAENRKILMPTLLAVFLILSLLTPGSATGASATVQLSDDYAINYSAMDSPNPASAMVLNMASVGQGQATPMVTAGYYHNVGLKADGNVFAVGFNYYGQCDVGSWTNIIQVTAGSQHTVGLKADGTVVAVGQTGGGKCNVGNWRDIIQVAAGTDHTVGVKADNTVVAVGYNGGGNVMSATGWMLSRLPQVMVTQ